MDSTTTICENLNTPAIGLDAAKVLIGEITLTVDSGGGEAYNWALGAVYHSGEDELDVTDHVCIASVHSLLNSESKLLAHVHVAICVECEIVK